MNIYKTCPTIENDYFLLRLVVDEDCEDLLKVYSDKNALPFFNSDNCNGDNFYYATKERMTEALGFWKMSYENGWFVRFAIVDKEISEVIGTIELCLRDSENRGVLRVDVGSDYEEENMLYHIFSLITPHISEWIGCATTITKAPIYAVERIKAIQKVGFAKLEDYLIGHNGYAYDGYWTIG